MAADISAQHTFLAQPCSPFALVLITLALDVSLLLSLFALIDVEENSERLLTQLARGKQLEPKTWPGSRQVIRPNHDQVHYRVLDQGHHEGHQHHPDGPSLDAGRLFE